MSLDKKNLLLLLCCGLLLIGVVYYPGLFGDYVFDDSANILENKKLAINSLNWQMINSAALSGDAGPLGRPLSMLSFALNYYFSGFEPFYFKLTNLLIHILNTVLVFLISRQIFISIRLSSSSWSALAVALLWGLHPLNLTSVLYIVQRMVSLSTLFGFLALYAYGRLRMLPSPTNKLGLIVRLSVVTLLIVASALSKESGLLFIPLIILLEFFVFRGRYQDQDLGCCGFKLIHILYFMTTVATLLVLTQLPKYMSPAAFLHRDFNLAERILTETRIIFFYLKLFIFPRITELSLYHDDFLISHSLTAPISTLYAILGLLGISGLCLALVKKAPMLLFAWCWFLIGHAMESTFISLELVHEHRNYFATIGLLLLSPLLYQQASKKTKPMLLLLFIVYTAYLGLSTWQRAHIWNNLADHAAFEANQHPYSDRANYQLARIYIKLMEQNQDNYKQKMHYADLVKKSLHVAKESYNPSNGAWFASLHLSYFLEQEPSLQIVEDLKKRLNTLPFYNSNIGFISAFANCQIEKHCKLPHHLAVEIFAAAAENPTINNGAKAEVLKVLARYFAEVAGDYLKAEEFLLDALQIKNDINGNLLLTQVYRGQGSAHKAQTQLDLAKQLDIKNTWFRETQHEQDMINILKKQISNKAHDSSNIKEAKK